MSDLSYTKILAEFACRTGFEAIPASARHATKRLILDTIGCAVGGFAMPSTQILEKVLGAAAGTGEATVCVSGRKLPMAQASYLNAHAANALDAEDTTLWAGHLSSCTVMPALAAVERAGATGRDLLSSVAVGFDVVSRIGLSMKQISVDAEGKSRMGSVRGNGWAAFAATVVVGRLIGLDVTQMLNAFGIAGSTAPLPSTGHWNYLPPPRPMTKYSMYGACAEAGVMAALLAREGFTGDRAILDGDTGLWRMFGSPAVDWDAIPDRLGQRWLIEETSFKYYPSCRFSHPAIDMAYDLRAALTLKPGEIERIDLQVPPHAFNLRMDDLCVDNAIDSQFSLPYMLALAFFGVEPGPRWHAPEMRTRQDIAALAQKVNITAHPEAAAVVMEQLKANGRAFFYPYALSVAARGQVFERTATFAKGDPWADAAFSDATLRKKLQAYCEDQLPTSQIDALYNLVMELEDQANLDALVANMVARPAGRNRTAEKQLQVVD